MNRSGMIKRGLATTAVAALAVTGIPFAANADSINDQVGANTVELFTPSNASTASTQNDGVNQTVRLLAGGGPEVAQVRFEYGSTASPTTIATVSRTNGAFSTEWAPPAALFNTTVAVRAVGLNSVGTPIAAATGTDAATVTISPGVPAVDIANAPGSAVGVFTQPYAGETVTGTLGAINGTTSGAGDITLVNESSAAAVTSAPITPGAANAQGIRTWRGTANFAGYNFDTTAPLVNEAVVRATQAGGSEDAEALTLEQQTIDDVTAVADPATVPTGSTGAAVVTVLDAADRPVAGAQVVADADRDGVLDAGETVSYTDANGQARFTGLAGSAAGIAYDFYVNTTDGNNFESAIDFRRTVTISSADQSPTTLIANSADGAAFDTEEFAAGDITVRVSDQGTAPIANQVVSYTWTFTAAATSTTPNPAPVTTTGTATTNAQGVATVGAPSNNFSGDGTYVLNAFINNNGTPGQQPGEPAAPALTVKAGDSTLAFTEAPTAVSAAGTTDTYEATLRLFDGTALAGRLVNFTYAPTANSVVAAQANQPTGTTRTGDTTANGTTNAQGAISVAISDPAGTPTTPAELNNTLNAATGSNTIGNAAESAAPLDVDFVANTAPTRGTVVISTIAQGKPGTAGTGTVTVTEDLDNNPATPATPVPAGQAVNLTIDGDAFFTNGAVTPGGTVGADATITNQGKTATVVTGANGVATFQTSIARSTGFDDDGLVTVNVAATAGPAGSATDTEPQTFSSAAPINGGELRIEEAAEQDDPTGPTRVGDDVNYDVTATDQFGNPVGGQSVSLTYAGPADATTGARPASITTDFSADGELSLSADEAGTVTVNGSWTAPRTFVYLTPTTAGAGNPATETLTDSATAEFYEVDFAESLFDIRTNARGTVPVGTAVTTAVTVVDQEGNPVEGLEVDFLRAGPGNQQDGDPNAAGVLTNANGQAFYNFIATEAGTARISAVVTEQGNSAPIRTLNTSVAIGQPVPPTVNITATANGRDNGGANDRINVNTRPGNTAAGAPVRLFTRVNGEVQRLQARRLNAQGRFTFNVRDRNGNGQTVYWVTIGPRPGHTGDRSTNIRVR